MIGASVCITGLHSIFHEEVTTTHSSADGSVHSSGNTSDPIVNTGGHTTANDGDGDDDGTFKVVSV